MRKKGAKVNAPVTPAKAVAESHEVDLGLERLVFFSDAVIAIAITLLALEIRLPATAGELNNAALLHNLLAIFPSYLGYVISFWVIGSFWLSHHRRFRLIVRYDRNLLLLNMLLLMLIAFIPFPTSVLSEYGNRTATIFYALTMTVTGLVSWAIGFYATQRNRLIAPALSPQEQRREWLRSLIVPTIFLFSIGIAWFDADLAKFSWLLIALAAKLI
ncbi:MAG: TMEM175 family protein [Caldilineaceae bacterium]